MPLKFFKKHAQKWVWRSGLTERDLIKKEAAIGGQLFGKLEPGQERQFFCLDEHTWVWYESWFDEKGQKHELTTRYEIRSNGIIKVQGNLDYHFVSDNEAQNLFKAISLYYQYVSAYVYNQTPQAI
ncbi:hypothetical protein DYH10_03115 [Candidatus Saccharibacteria bacterium CPR2]|nr:hypothetical protein [Candidatus Saccharibacteria bacterium CPR2]